MVHIHRSSTHMADATKNCELFYFRSLSQVHKLLSSVATGLKKHLRQCVCPVNRTARASGVNWLQSSRGGVSFCCFSLVCLVRFLTLVNNLPIFQRTNGRSLKTSALFVSVVSGSCSCICFYIKPQLHRLNFFQPVCCSCICFYIKPQLKLVLI